MRPPLPPATIAILLSTYDGGPFLRAQLASYVAQEGVNWRLYWRDDGSSDESAAVLEQFAAGFGEGRCCRVDSDGHRGVTASYMALLRAAVADGAETVAFSDQDDVWLPHKLARSCAQLGAGPAPALYCSRQILVDRALQRLGESAPVRVPPGIGPALTQNIATGCTVVLNRAAAEIVAASIPPAPSLHDWWSYLVVSAAGGRIIADPEPTVLYRQHGGNAVGAPPSNIRRAFAALRRGPGTFMTVLRAHVSALEAQPHLVSPAARPVIDAAAAGLRDGMRPRLAALRLGLLRQTTAETWLFRLWFLIG